MDHPSHTATTTNTIPENGTGLVENDHFVGFHTTPYGKVVKPKSVWPVSKYFLRRWVPYLGAERFWLIITAQQLAYRENKLSPSFHIYDAKFYGDTPFSRRTFYRLKPEMGQWNNETKKVRYSTHPLSLFIATQPPNYTREDNTTKQEASWYWIRQDDVLTPGDAVHLKVWLEQQGGATIKRPEDVKTLLECASEMVEKNKSVLTLLAPSQTPYLHESRVYAPVTVLDIVHSLYQSSLITPEVQAAADALHQKLTDDNYYGTNYFRYKWLPELEPGPALLLTCLRANSFVDQEGKANKDRDTIDVTQTGLAEYFQVGTKTISRWLGFLETAVAAHPSQPHGPLIKQVGKNKLATNDVQYTYQVCLREPIHPDDLPTYEAHLRQYQDSGGDGDLDTHATTPKGGGNGHLDTHTTTPEGGGDGYYGTHTSAPKGGGNGHLDTHTTVREGGVTDILAQPQAHFGTTSSTFWHTIKYYKYYNKMLEILSLNKKDFLVVVVECPFWKIDENTDGLQSFAQAAYGTVEQFCSAVGITGNGVKDISRSNLSLEQVAGWYLYAHHIKLDNPPGYIVKRAREKATPPQPFEHLATLSWELWRVYICLTQLPAVHQEEFAHCPGFREWMRYYGQNALPTSLPGDVGKGITEFLDALDTIDDPVSHDVEVRPEMANWQSPTDGDTAVWKATMGEMQLQMTRATFNTWFKDVQLMGVLPGGATYVIGVRNEYAKDWIANRLTDMLKRTLNALAAMMIQATTDIDLMFVVVDGG